MFDTTIHVRMHDEISGVYFAGDVSLDKGNHGSLRDFTRDGYGAEQLVERMLTNPDTWDLLCETTEVSVKNQHYVRVETYRIADAGMFFEIEEQGGVVLSGYLQLRKLRNEYQVCGNLKVITYLGKKEVCTKSTYHPNTRGLWQRGDEMVVACNSFGHLTEIA